MDSQTDISDFRVTFPLSSTQTNFIEAIIKINLLDTKVLIRVLPFLPIKITLLFSKINCMYDNRLLSTDYILIIKI